MNLNQPIVMYQHIHVAYETAQKLKPQTFGTPKITTHIFSVQGVIHYYAANAQDSTELPHSQKIIKNNQMISAVFPTLWRDSNTGGFCAFSHFFFPSKSILHCSKSSHLAPSTKKCKADQVWQELTFSENIGEDNQCNIYYMLRWFHQESTDYRCIKMDTSMSFMRLGNLMLCLDLTILLPHQES